MDFNTETKQYDFLSNLKEAWIKSSYVMNTKNIKRKTYFIVTKLWIDLNFKKD